ncbi:MAG: TolC family protein [Phycisphaerales bacterium]
MPTTKRGGGWRVAPIGILLAGGLGACSGPLCERESDRGRHVGLDRLRDVQPLSIEQFRAAGDSIPETSEQAAARLERPPSRFDGLERVTLSLEQCRAEALVNNLDLKVALVDPLIAGETLNVERAKFDAVFQPFLRFRNDDRPTLQTTSANQQEALSIGGGVDIPLRTGGRISVDYAQSRVESAQAIFSASQLYSSDATVSISQPLLRNAGRDVNVASIQIAGYNQQIAEARTKLQVIAQIAATDRAYWRLYAAIEALRVVQQQYEVAAEQLAQAQRRVDAGDVAEIEIVRAQSGVAERLESIIIAENNVLVAQRELKRVINTPGLDVGTRQMVIPGTSPEPVRYELEESPLLEMARTTRMELLEAELQLLADAVSEGFQRNQLLPLLNLDASYTWSGLGTTFHDNNSEIASGRFQSYSLGISGEVPLGNDAAEAQLRRAVFTRLQRAGSKEAREQSIRQEVLDAIDRVRAGWQRILAARQAAILAGRTLEGERRQLQQGVRTTTDVLDAAARLADAQLAEIRALADYQIAQTDLAVATGTTLGAGRVSWAPDARNVPRE